LRGLRPIHACCLVDRTNVTGCQEAHSRTLVMAEIVRMPRKIVLEAVSHDFGLG
jgi:hypothetical protein